MTSFSVLRPLLLLLLLLLGGLLLSGCSQTANYLDPNGPRYTGQFATTPPQDDGLFRGATWNIQYGQNIPQAITVLQQSPDLQNLDVLLLQEMDSEGTASIAQALGMNFVYYPASIHPKHRRDFGEAILSPWPLKQDQKLLLPHYSPRNGQVRIAVVAQVQTPTPVWVYNTHLETSLMDPKQRLEQLETILQDAETRTGPILLGGDFNTLTPLEREALVAHVRKAGFVWATSKVEGTVPSAEGLITLDYLFARGFTPVDAGVVTRTPVSDHWPLWATLRVER